MITTTTVKPNGAGPDLAAEERWEELARQAIAMLAQVKGEVPPASLTWPQFSLAEARRLTGGDQAEFEHALAMAGRHAKVKKYFEGQAGL